MNLLQCWAAGPVQSGCCARFLAIGGRPHIWQLLKAQLKPHINV